MRPSTEVDFWKKVDQSRGPEACWEWTGCLFKGAGYGQFRLLGEVVAHRIAWRLAFGDIPTWMVICHKCDNRKCCNPKHLFMGRHSDNSADMVSKGRQAFGQRHGRYTRPESTARGERVNTAVATEALVVEIRAAYDSGRKIAEIARQYNVSWDVVKDAAYRLTWKHVPEKQA